MDRFVYSLVVFFGCVFSICRYTATLEASYPLFGNFGKCLPCDSGTYQTQADHRQTTCDKQTSCALSTYVQESSDGTRDRICIPCAPNTYTNVTNAHTCTLQPFCAAGQFMSKESFAQKRTCSPCPQGKYQDQLEHRRMQCEPQTRCPVGQSIVDETNPAVVKQRCIPCPSNEFQNASSHQKLTCYAQSFCGLGHKLSAVSDTSNAAWTKRTCIPCETGTYMNSKQHRLESCVPHTECSDSSYELLKANNRTAGSCQQKQVVVRAYERYFPEGVENITYVGGLQTNATYDMYFGESYRIAPVRLTNASNLDLTENVRFALYDTPDGVFLDGKTGEILAVPILPQELRKSDCIDCQARHFTATLVGFYGPTAYAHVESLYFNVRRRPAFRYTNPKAFRLGVILFRVVRLFFLRHHS